MFTAFMFLVLVAWLVPVAPAARDLGRLIGKPPGTSLGAWFVAGLMGHDDQAEDICPQASWACAMGEARARTGWHAALTWGAAHPGPVLAGAGALVAAFWLPEHIALGAIVLVRGLPGTRPATWCTWRTRSRRPGSSSRIWTWIPRHRCSCAHRCPDAWASTVSPRPPGTAWPLGGKTTPARPSWTPRACQYCETYGRTHIGG